MTIKEAVRREHDRADRAMTRVFNRLAACQQTSFDGGVCGACLLIAVQDWRRFTAKGKRK